MFVEAIETLFVPVAVQNNADGEDARALKRFGETAWNNPVVRFLDGNGKDLIERREGVWKASDLAQRMSTALVQAKREPPAWWKLAELDARCAQLPRAVFAVHCFWVGQEKLGAIDGVADARPAFLEELEVVDVRYDPARVSLADLIAQAKQVEVADRIWVTDDEELKIARTALGEQAAKLTEAPKLAPDSDDLRALHASVWKKLQAPRTQSVRLNALLAAGAPIPAGLLSPRQLELQQPKSAR